MRSMKKKSMEQLTSALMVLIMAITTTASPVMTLANEMKSSTVVESQSTAKVISAEESSSVGVQTQADTQAGAESTGIVSEASGNNESMSDTQNSETMEAAMQTTVTTYEEQTALLTLTESSKEESAEISANETCVTDEVTEEEIAKEAEKTDSAESYAEEPSIMLSSETTKEEILSYIEAIGGNDSDAYYAFVESLSEDDYQLVWMAQYGVKEDQLAEKFDFDYDGSSDLDVAKYIYKLAEDDLIDFVENMTFDQYRRYLSIKEMMADMDEKDFSNVIDEEEFDSDRTWDYESYDAFAELLTGVSLQRTEQTMQFYNTYVDSSQVRTGVTTIDGLLDSNADWYSNDYILGLDPEMFKETVPIYYGSDGNYYVVSTVPTLNGIESADYQPATNFYNGSVEAQAFTDIEYLGNGAYRIPSSRYQYCFTEQYVSDMGTLYGISFGLRIQVLYGSTPSGEITIAADVVYPDMTERFLPATLNLLAGTATVRIFNDGYDDSTDNYLVSASINRGASLPDSVGSMNDGKVLQFVVNDAYAVGSLDVLIGYNATSKYSMAAEVTTQELYASQTTDADISQAAEMYNGAYLKLDQSSVPKDLAVGDKFIYANTGLTIVGVNTATDGSGAQHVGASVVPTHDSQSFCFYNGKGVDSQISSWFKTQLNTNSADPGYMVQMTTANISARASYNGASVNLGGNKIFGYVTDGLGSVVGTSGNTLNLEGTNVILSCMHAWGNESATTPQDILTSVSTFTGRTQKDYAIDEGYGHYHPNVALQCTEVHDGGDGYTYATFKVVTSMLHVGGIAYAENYQCAFSTLRIAYPSAPKTGYLKIHKSSSNPEITNGNSCYSFDSIDYGIFTDQECVNNIAILNLDADGYSDAIELNEGTYYVREAYATPGSGYQTNGHVYTVQVTAGSTANSPMMCETTDTPMNDQFGIVINKINSDKSTSADMSGAEYTVKYYAGQYTSVNELPSKATYIWVIKTAKALNGNYCAMLDDEHIVSGTAKYGKNNQGTYIIPLGTITVQETKAPAGFTIEGATVSSAKTGAAISEINGLYLFRLVDENSAVYLKSGNSLSIAATDETAMTINYFEVQNKCGISIQKSDAMTGTSTPSANADLSGIKFAIINSTGASITYNKRVVVNGGTVMIITTDANGYAATGASDLPIGTYTVRELRKDASFSESTLYEGTSTLANDTYIWEDNRVTVTLTDANAKKIVSAGTVYNTPVTAIPKFEKYDTEIGKKETMAGTSFAGVIYQIYNGSTNPVKVDGKSYKKDEVIQSICADANGNFTFTAELPIGDYYVKESGNSYYLGNDQTRYFHVICANEKGTVSYDAGYTSVVFANRVIRGDFSLTKKNSDTGAVIAGIPFKVTNTATGETHYILTDADGNFNSSVNKTTNINANDTVLSKYNPKDIIPQSVIESLTKDAGVWFGLGSDKTMTKANASYGSLVCGTYIVTEMKTEATKSMTMLSAIITINSDGQKFNLGDMVNIPVKISTTLTDDMDNDHYAKADAAVNFTDAITYQDLPTGKTYTIIATLYVKDGSNLTEHAKKTVTFMPTTSNGTTKVQFENVSTKGLAGKSLVCYEELTCDGEFIAEHKNPNDEGQTVHFPSVKTKAEDAESKTNYAAPKENAEIIDTVSYTNLIPEKLYQVTGKLISKTTGQVVTVDGKEITVTKMFTASDSGSGTIEISFKFNATGLTGQYVVFETICDNNVAVAVHEDINDTNQTILFSKLTVLKLSSDRDYVAGAKLEIRDSEGNVVEAFETDGDKNVFYHLKFDTDYTLVENEAPTGFLIANPITFRLKENGKILVDESEVDELEMEDEYSTGYLEITKQSAISHKLIPDAIYGIYSDEECTTLVDTLKTDENGSAASKELEHGQYWVKELKAPQGYRFDYTVYGPYEVEGRHKTVSDTLYDVPVSPVPTGIIMTFWPYLVVMGVGIVLFAGLTLLKKITKKRE